MLNTVEKHHMLNHGDHVCVGLSGGADSVALLFLLLECAKQYGLTVSAVHINHGIRGAEAARDEQFAAKICKDRSVRLLTKHVNVPAFAAEKKYSLEEAGRIARYIIFDETLSELGADKIALAHHKNDNAETLLMRLFRGSGLTGLMGIPPVRGAIIRPLIDLSRADVERFCKANSIPFVEDSTNKSDTHTRNLIRMRVIPLIEQYVNQSAVEAICRAALLCQEDCAYIDAVAAQAFIDTSETCGDSLSFCADALNALPGPILRRVLRMGISQLNGGHGLKDVTSDHIAFIAELLNKETNKTICLPQGNHATVAYRRLFLYNSNNITENFCYNITIGETIFVKQAGIFVLATSETAPYLPENSCTKAFSYDKIKNGLQIRNTRSGDKIYFSQIDGHKKLNDFFAQRRLPRHLRQNVALLADGSDILWIIDQRHVFSGAYEPSEQTKNLLYVSVYTEGERQ